MTEPIAPALAEVLVGEYPALLQRARRALRSDADAEDAAQEAMLAVLRAPHLLAGVERLGAWLSQLVYRRAVDIIRGNVRRRAGDADAGLAELFAGDDPEELMARDEVCAAVAAAIDELPPELRFAFVQNALEDRTFQEMSAQSGIPMGTLMARKQKAVELIRSRLRRQRLLA